MGEHIVSLVPSGDIALFITTPGALNLPAADRWVVGQFESN
jgi:hypothetical protein